MFRLLLLALGLSWTLSFQSSVRLDRDPVRTLRRTVRDKSRQRVSSFAPHRKVLRVSTAKSTTLDENVPLSKAEKRAVFWKLDKEFVNVALPAFVALAADPLASIVDAMYVGRLGAVDQAAMGISISAQYSIAKLYNDPLLKTSTSLVAGKTGEDLEASVATALVTAAVIGGLQTMLFLVAGSQILQVMGVGAGNVMRSPALAYLRWRALGVPAATMLLVVNGIFRGRGDTRTPLYCTVLGNLVNVLLDPIFIFSCHMGCAGAGAATAISQWVSVMPMLFLLHKSVPIKIFGRGKGFFRSALQSYIEAGLLLFFRTVAKVSAYAVTSSAAARLGTVPMAAYSLTFNLGFATSQLCESVSIAAQSLLARDFPFHNSPRRRVAAAHIIRRALVLGAAISGALSVVTHLQQDRVLSQLTSSAPVFLAAKQIMPVVLATQLFKGLAYSTGGIILGGLDWFSSSLGMTMAAVACVLSIKLLPPSLWNIWVSLAIFMAMQVVVAGLRIFSGRGPWANLPILSDDNETRKELQTPL